MVFIIFCSFHYNTFTDCIDGHIAELPIRLKWASWIIADKFLITAAIIALVQLNKIPGWIAFVIISRDLTVDLLRILAASEGVLFMQSIGETKNYCQVIAVITIAGQLSISFN